MSIIEKSIIAAEKRVSPKSSHLKQANNAKSNLKTTTDERIIDWPTDKFKRQLDKSSDNQLFISQFRQLKRSVIRAAFGPLAEPGSNIVIITSPLPNAGKTFITMNIANAMSNERDRKVLLIDADNAKHSLTDELELGDRTGFFDLLNDKSLHVNDFIIKPRIPRLEVIPTGHRYSDSAELLSSRRAIDLLKQLAKQDPDRLIIFDAPPLLATSDAPALSDLGGLFLLVIDAGTTTHNQLEQALQIFSEKDTVGLILNKASLSSSSLLGQYAKHYGAEMAHDPQ